MNTDHEIDANPFDSNLKDCEVLFQLLSSIRDSVLAMDGNGIIFYCNDALLRLLGWTKQDALGFTNKEIIQRYVAEESKERLLNNLDKNYIEGVVCLCRDGSRKTVDMTRTALKDLRGEHKGVITILHDVSERMEYETKLKLLVEELSKINKGKNAFIAKLSHELRNPLASVMAASALLRQAGTTGGKANKYIDIIDRQAVQLNRIVDDLLDVSRITQDKFELSRELIECNDLVKKAVSDYQPQYGEKGIDLEAIYSSDPFYVDADRVRLLQSLGNLLGNSMKFSKTGDKTKLTLTKDNNTSEAVITILDTGMGIDSDFLPLVFEPFTQDDTSLDRKNGGLGLGLAIAKGILALHGGSLSVYSDGIGKGSEFTVRLPLSPVNYGPAENAAGNNSVPLSSLKILVIDDNKDLLEIMCELLGSLGHQVYAESNGADGIIKAKEVHPDLLICDIGLPGMDGYEVARIISSSGDLNGIYRLALSGYAQPQDLERSKAAGFHRHLAKPVNFDLLKNALDEVFRFKNPI